MKILKLSTDYIYLPLANILNVCISDSIFPNK